MRIVVGHQGLEWCNFAGEIADHHESVRAFRERDPDCRVRGSDYIVRGDDD